MLLANVPAAAAAKAEEIREPMRIDPFPPGLVNRYVYSRRDRTVVIDETWDVSVSGCPMIPIP